MRDVTPFGVGHAERVRPPTLPADAIGAGLAYHRLGFLRPRAAWWTPLLVGVVGVVLYLAGILLLVVLASVLGVLNPAVEEALATTGTGVLFDPENPIVLVMGLGTIAVMLPAYALASRIAQGPRVGYLSSAAGRLRWGWLLLCGAIALGVEAAITALATVLLPASELDPATATPDPPLLVAGLVVVILLVPVQAAAEEYVFRGYLMQSIGRWVRRPAFAIILPIPLFVAGHDYDPLGQSSIALFALVARWLSWRTGGLEAAIALHVVNNLAAFALGVFGLSDPNETNVSVESLVVSVVLMGAYAGVIEWAFRRSGLGRTVVVTLPPPVAPAVVEGPSLGESSAPHS